jgi:chitin disaccharide deacetylase
MKRVVVCADDFGLTTGVSSGILACLERKVISATSCMTLSASWPEMSRHLRKFVGSYDIGLHLTLTDQPARGLEGVLTSNQRFHSVGKLLRLCLVGRLPRLAIEQEIRRQLDLFESHLGGLPSHVDGHHHVHQFPIIRSVLIKVLTERYKVQAPYLRVSQDRIANVLRRGVAVGKAIGIGSFGNRLRKLAVQSGVATNDTFSGVYGFNSDCRLEELFGRFAANAGARHLIMTHPGRADDALILLDSLTTQRDREMNFLLSNQWQDILQGNDLFVGQLREPAEVDQ